MTDTTKPLDLAAIQARAEAASPGPWERAVAPAEGSPETHAEYLAGTLLGEGEPLHVLTCAPPRPEYTYGVPAVTGDGPTSRANAEFIAAARDDVPALVAALVEARARQAQALSLLRVAEAADRDIVSGRPLLDAVDERDTALSSAIRILAEE